MVEKYGAKTRRKTFCYAPTHGRGAETNDPDRGEHSCVAGICSVGLAIISTTGNCHRGCHLTGRGERFLEVWAQLNNMAHT